MNNPGDDQLFTPVIAAIRGNQDRLKQLRGVVGIRPGFSEMGDATRPAPVIVVLNDGSHDPAEMPAELEGIKVETRRATALDLVEGIPPLEAWEEEGSVAERAPVIHYVAPEKSEVALEEMNVGDITCHVGPDSGWTTLQPFLEGTTVRLTVAMYEFYADHILDTVTTLGKKQDLTLNMILQVSANDRDTEGMLSESWRDRLDFAKASVSGPNRIFNNSYHTKVAVRDGTAFWLSSGNWSPNSQPLIKAGSENALYKNGNREWHVIIGDEEMAQMYEKFILYDMRMAREAEEAEAAPLMPDLLVPESFFEPEAVVLQDHPFTPRVFAASGDKVPVRPLMSPDNYASEILKLIRSAKETLYLQFSYIRQPSGETFDSIISAIADKMTAGLDVRVIVSSNQAPAHSDLLIGTRKWKREMLRKQTSKLHNKGILVDGEIAVVGSNNWSSDGTQYNRDTSLIFYSAPITQYYTEVFLFDWDNLTRPIGQKPEITPLLAPESGPTPPGMVRIPWQTWYND